MEVSAIIQIIKGPDIESVSRVLADKIHTDLQQAIESRGQATIALSGGTSPAKTMQFLSQKELDWSRVIITLSDERWLPPDSPRSNHLLIKQNMLVNLAEPARFLSLYLPDTSPWQAVVQLQQRLESSIIYFDVCLLGMGTDGHFASLLPDSHQLQEGLTSSKSLVAVKSSSVPEDRISMTLSFISKAHNIYLLIAGARKRQLLRQTMNQTGSTLPIATLLNRVDLNVFEAEND